MNREKQKHIMNNKFSTIVSMFLLLLLGSGCKDSAIKIYNVKDFMSEFADNNATATAKYKGQTVEFIGSFSDMENFPFLCYDTSLKTCNSAVQIFCDYNADSLKRNSIYHYLHEVYFYNTNTKEIYTNEAMNQIAKSVLTNSDRTTNTDNHDIYGKLDKVADAIHKAIKSKNSPIDTPLYLRSKEIQMNEGNGFFYPMDTEINISYPDLKAIANDIRGNKIHRCDSLRETIIDKVTLRGKIKDISIAQNGAGENVIVIHLEKVEIRNKERIFDFNTLPILDYMAGQKALEEKISGIHLITPTSDTSSSKGKL